MTGGGTTATVKRTMSSDYTQTEGGTDTAGTRPMAVAAISGQRAVYDAVQALTNEQRWLNHQGATAMRQMAAVYRGGRGLAGAPAREPVVIELDEIDERDERRGTDERDPEGRRGAVRIEPPSEDAFDAFLATFEPELPTQHRASV
ncbi:hypothetical protein ACFQPA_04585 [Halomarina halobia]|uniref:Uncharacterized protein n=1 Tax=Halomarina halobia TaxID=3033386 RepID=A0ABD6A6R3_9EURY|nr:hypothetical protein [Halomarina sp. PSR21]